MRTIANLYYARRTAEAHEIVTRLANIWSNKVLKNLVLRMILWGGGGGVQNSMAMQLFHDLVNYMQAHKCGSPVRGAERQVAPEDEFC